MLETIVAGDPETEGTTPAAVAVPVVIIIVIVIIVVIAVIIYRNRYSTTVHDTHTLRVSYSCYYYPQTGLHTTPCEYLCSMV